MAGSKALDKLVASNLGKANNHKNGELKKTKKLSKSEQRLRRQHRAEILLQRSYQPPTGDTKPVKKVKPITKKTPTAEETEIENLKNEIVKELSTQESYVKRKSRVEVPSFAGLTPGLAPIGYDPDESDGEDPY